MSNVWNRHLLAECDAYCSYVRLIIKQMSANVVKKSADTGIVRSVDGLIIERTGLARLCHDVSSRASDAASNGACGDRSQANPTGAAEVQR